MTRAERIRGCLLAGACGDALGAPVEFLRLAEIRRRYGPSGIVDLDRAHGRVGAITDDTQMTLFTAEGLLRARAARKEGGELDAATGEAAAEVAAAPAAEAAPEVHRAYMRWLATQGGPLVPESCGGLEGLYEVAALHARRAPGNTCLTSLEGGVMGTPDRRLNDSKGCGGVMRAAPAGLVGTRDPFALGVAVAAITHSHPAGYLSAGYLALLIARILEGTPLGDAAASSLERLESEPEHGETSRAVRGALDLAAAGSPSAETVERLGGGWVGEEALAIALYCALSHPTDLEAALILAANHSGDTDSTAAIAGNIMGALLGPSAIPARWLEPLELRDVIEGVAADLATP